MELRQGFRVWRSHDFPRNGGSFVCDPVLGPYYSTIFLSDFDRWLR
jgi:hypothetical protein